MTGCLVYVMGPSGSGKDSLLRRARDVLSGRPAGPTSLCFAHRYITRPASVDAENHVALSPAEFDARRQAGLFALHWHSHGLDYGIGVEVMQWLAQGLTVVVNGSRAHLPAARERFPALRAVLVDVSPQTQRQRLLARGREEAAAVEARLARSAALGAMRDEDVLRIENEGSLEDGVALLLALLTRLQAPAAPTRASVRPGGGAWPRWDGPAARPAGG